jgi:hypothetical protein
VAEEPGDVAGEAGGVAEEAECVAGGGSIGGASAGAARNTVAEARADGLSRRPATRAAMVNVLRAAAS